MESTSTNIESFLDDVPMSFEEMQIQKQKEMGDVEMTKDVEETAKPAEVFKKKAEKKEPEKKTERISQEEFNKIFDQHLGEFQVSDLSKNEHDNLANLQQKLSKIENKIGSFMRNYPMNSIELTPPNMMFHKYFTDYLKNYKVDASNLDYFQDKFSEQDDTSKSKKLTASFGHVNILQIFDLKSPLKINLKQYCKQQREIQELSKQGKPLRFNKLRRLRDKLVESFSKEWAINQLVYNELTRLILGYINYYSKFYEMYNECKPKHSSVPLNIDFVRVLVLRAIHTQLNKYSQQFLATNAQNLDDKEFKEQEQMMAGLLNFLDNNKINYGIRRLKSMTKNWVEVLKVHLEQVQEMDALSSNSEKSTPSFKNEDNLVIINDPLQNQRETVVTIQTAFFGGDGTTTESEDTPMKQ